MRKFAFGKAQRIPTRANYVSRWKSIVIVAVISGYLPFYQYSQAYEVNSDTSLTKAQIEQLIDAPQSDQRQEAANSILSAMGSDTTWAFETIISGILIEESYLKHSNEVNQGYVWFSWWNIQKYVRDLAFLGSHSAASLEKFGENLPPDQETWVLIAEGYQKKILIHDKIREIIAQKGNPAQKAMAVEAISHYRDTTDIPILVDAALDAENFIEWAGESDLPGLNPVAPACVIALRDLGYALEWDSKEFRARLKKLDETRNKIQGPK